MILIRLNGEERSVPEQWTIEQLLKDLQINNRYCAVERNQSLIPREEHAQCVLNNGDQIEIVTLVGGG
jgi:thiamine biosynthesis protein ThiS